jgi:hypothetical protein
MPSSNQPDRQRQLYIVVAALVPVHEVLQVERNIPLLQIATPPQFLATSAETSSAHPSAVLKPTKRIGLVLTAQEVGDHGVEIGVFSISFRPYPARATKIVENLVDVLIVIAGHDLTASNWTFALPELHAQALD